MGMEKTTEMVLAQELFEQGLSKSAIARRVGRDRKTIRLWLRAMAACCGCVVLKNMGRRRF
jgi:transposase